MGDKCIIQIANVEGIIVKCDNEYSRNNIRQALQNRFPEYHFRESMGRGDFKYKLHGGRCAGAFGGTLANFLIDNGFAEREIDLYGRNRRGQ